MILLRQRGITGDRSNGWGYGSEGWYEGGGGYDYADSVGNGMYQVTPANEDRHVQTLHERLNGVVAMCVSQLYLLEQVINQRTDAPVQRSEEMSMKSIVVVEAGWVLIGEYVAAKDGKPAHMTDASVIRRWGTTAGLGQIALTGPTSETILDPCGMVVFDNQQAILFVIKCSV